MIGIRGAIFGTLFALLALAAAGLVLGHAAGSGAERAELKTAWSLDAVPAFTIERLSRSGQRPALALVTRAAVRVVAEDGRVVATIDRLGIEGAAAGDLDGDGNDELVLGVSGRSVEVLDTTLSTRFRAHLEATPKRFVVTDLLGDGRRELVVADERGFVTALDAAGRLLWALEGAADPRADSEPRGLDDVKLGPQQRARAIAFGLRGGSFGVVTGAGRIAWRKATSGPLRRLRAADLDGDGADEIVVSDDRGNIEGHDAQGRATFSWNRSEAVGEIRGVATGRGPAVALGGKKGRLELLKGDTVLWSDGLESKVTALLGADTDGDGRDEIAAASDKGELAVFREDGYRLVTARLGAEVQALRTLPVSDGVLLVAAAGQKTVALRLSRARAPGWFRPELGAGLGALLAIGLVVVLLRPLPDPPSSEAPVPDADALRQRTFERRVARIDELVASGRLRPEQARERRAQLERERGRAARSKPPASPPPPAPRR